MIYPAIRIEGAILAPDILERIEDAPGQRPADFGLDRSARVKDEIARVWADAQDYWRIFSRKIDSLKPGAQMKIDGSVEPTQLNLDDFEEVWTGDYIFENEWQSFRTKKDRSLELTSVTRECPPGRRKIAVKVVDIFGNDTMTIVEVRV